MYKKRGKKFLMHESEFERGFCEPLLDSLGKWEVRARRRRRYAAEKRAELVYELEFK